MDADVIVVGSGIAGMTSAHFLQEAGYKVIVLEENTICSGATGQSTGVLWYGSGLNLVPTIEKFGEEKANKLWKETDETIDEMKKLIEKNDIGCELRNPGAICAARNSQEDDLLKNEYNAMKKIGLPAKLLDAAEMKGYYLASAFTSGLMEDCSQIRPLKFVTSLAKVMNINVWQKTPMVGYEEKNQEVLVKTGKQDLRCEKLVVATNLKPFLGFEKFFTKETTVALYSKSLGPKIKNIFPREKIFWMLDEHYDMIYPLDKRVVLELFKFKEVKTKWENYFPYVDFDTEQRRFGSWAKSEDTLPIFGKVSDNIISAIAMGDQGIVMGFTCGRKSLNVIENREDEFLKMTDPKRFGKLFKTNLP